MAQTRDQSLESSLPLLSDSNKDHMQTVKEKSGLSYDSIEIRDEIIENIKLEDGDGGADITFFDSILRFVNGRNLRLLRYILLALQLYYFGLISSALVVCTPQYIGGDHTKIDDEFVFFATIFLGLLLATVMSTRILLRLTKRWERRLEFQSARTYQWRLHQRSVYLQDSYELIIAFLLIWIPLLVGPPGLVIMVVPIGQWVVQGLISMTSQNCFSWNRPPGDKQTSIDVVDV